MVDGRRLTVAKCLHEGTRLAKILADRNTGSQAPDFDDSYSNFVSVGFATEGPSDRRSVNTQI